MIATMPVPMAFICSSARPRRAFGSIPAMTCPMKVTSPICSASALGPLPPDSANAFFASESSFSIRLRSLMSVSMRTPTSSGAVFNIAATFFNCVSRPTSHKRAASPVSASIRRMPLATAPSDTIVNKAMSPNALTWVPPHSSNE